MNIVILKDNTESMEIVLGGAVTTNELQFTSHYFDEASGTQTLSSANGVSNGTTDVEIIAAPSSGQRVVKEITVYNADTVSAVVTVKVVDGANERIIAKKTLSSGSAYVFTDAAASAGSGATNLDELTDVTIAAVAQGDILVRDGTEFVNTNIGTNEIVARIAGEVEGLAVAASRIVGRKSTGDVGAMTAAEVKTFLGDLATINFLFDGGGSVITTGFKGVIEVPFACTITDVTMLADQSGSIVVDIWKDTYANYPPTDADTITASAVPTITTATKSQDSTLTGWTTAIAANDILGFNVDSITTCERVTLALRVKKT